LPRRSQLPLSTRSDAAGEASSLVILGKGTYRYQVVENWGELPPGYTYGDTAAVCVDSKDNVYVFTRGAHPVIVYDRNGKFLRSRGEDIGFANAHGAAAGPDDMLYLTDDFGHAVRKCTTDGRVVLTIGTPKKPAPAFSGDPFNRCTHTALSPQGDIYVSDGYANARVHKYSPDGKLLFSWGEWALLSLQDRCWPGCDAAPLSLDGSALRGTPLLNFLKRVLSDLVLIGSEA
jgi:hypothetical protein